MCGLGAEVVGVFEEADGVPDEGEGECHAYTDEQQTTAHPYYKVPFRGFPHKFAHIGRLPNQPLNGNSTRQPRGDVAAPDVKVREASLPDRHRPTTTQRPPGLE